MQLPPGLAVGVAAQRNVGLAVGVGAQPNAVASAALSNVSVVEVLKDVAAVPSRVRVPLNAVAAAAAAAAVTVEAEAGAEVGVVVEVVELVSWSADHLGS